MVGGTGLEPVTPSV